MNGSSWDNLDPLTLNEFLKYSMYDIFALAELYAKV
jgi:hypothetical protein